METVAFRHIFSRLIELEKRQDLKQKRTRNFSIYVPLHLLKAWSQTHKVDGQECSLLGFSCFPRWKISLQRLPAKYLTQKMIQKQKKNANPIQPCRIHSSVFTACQELEPNLSHILNTFNAIVAFLGKNFKLLKETPQKQGRGGCAEVGIFSEQAVAQRKKAQPFLKLLKRNATSAI